ncbi:MAG: hypothetical protein JWR19_2156 [Pedosphaera sp.]|nr:hypothetical protein [Pedosphaera sp.]
MNQGSVIIGSHLYFVREGDVFTVPGAGVAGRNAKPGATDTSWIDLGIIKDCGVTPTREEREIFAPTPGQIRLYDVIETKRKLEYKIALQEMSPLVWELLFGTLPLTLASTQYNPLSGPTKKGWLKLQQYKQDDTLFNTVDSYCQLIVDGEVKFDDNVIAVNLTARQLHSTLNTGALA